MSDRMRTMEAAMSASYPPSVLNPEPPPVPVPATGATAGAPGFWTPVPAIAPANVTAVVSGNPQVIAPNPLTRWTVGQYVVCADGGECFWGSDDWYSGRATAVGADPTSSTVDQVKAYVESLGDESDPAVQAIVQAILDAERAGQNRVTLVSWLDERDGIE